MLDSAPTTTPAHFPTATSTSLKATSKLVAYIDNNQNSQSSWSTFKMAKSSSRQFYTRGECLRPSDSDKWTKHPSTNRLRNDDETSVIKTNMFFALPINRLFNYLYQERTKAVKLMPYAVS